PGQHQGVRVHDPLQLRVAGVQLPRQRRQGDVDDRPVDADDEDAQADGGQGRALSDSGTAGFRGRSGHASTLRSVDKQIKLLDVKLVYRVDFPSWPSDAPTTRTARSPWASTSSVSAGRS